MSEPVSQEKEKEVDRKKVIVYEAPRVLASYSKEEVEAVMQPEGNGSVGSACGCGCG